MSASDVSPTKLGPPPPPPAAIHDIDSLKSDCDWAMSELLTLKLHQSDTLRKCEQAVRDADVLRASLQLSQHQQHSTEAEVTMGQSSMRVVARPRHNVQSGCH
jgi:hypothetical protein